MTNYVRDLTSTVDLFRKDAERLAQNLRADATIINGVIRWNSNNRVPPEDCVELAVHIGLPIDLEATTAARDADTDAFLSEYRKNYKGPTEEERMEARAAHGEGIELVNVVTGHKWTT